MDRYIQEIASHFNDEIVLIEPGSGNGKKTHLLLKNLPHLAGYIPIDISKDQLLGVAAHIAYEYPQLEVLPVCADFTQPFDLPPVSGNCTRKLIYYPGSTIGNQSPQNATLLLKQIRQLCNPGDALVVGVDLKKDPTVLKLAYADPAGANGRFILNPLTVLKREFEIDFDISKFEHHVVVNEPNSCVEIYMKCLSDHALYLGGQKIEFTEGELIERAVSYKYTQDAFQKLAEQAGWKVEHVWLDEQQWFGVHHLSPTE